MRRAALIACWFALLCASEGAWAQEPPRDDVAYYCAVYETYGSYGCPDVAP